MRLALVTHKFVRGDGQGRVNLEIAQEALRRGHHVTMLATEADPELTAHSAARWVPVPVAPWPTALLRHQVFAARSALWLRRHRKDYDLLGVNGFVTWPAGDVNAAHMIHDAWRRSPYNTAPPGLPERLYRAAYTSLNVALERRAYRKARRVVAVSERVGRELSDIGVSAAQLRVIPNGVDLAEFRPRRVGRAEFGLPEGVPMGLFVGDIRIHLKNLETVLTALVDASDVHLTVVGDPRHSPYPAMAERLGVAARVHFLGFRADVARIMGAVDFLAFPSRYESFSLALLEAMAAGLPVITAATVGASYLVTPDAGIVLNDPNDDRGLAEALQRLAEDAALRLCMGRAARAIAEQHGWAQMADRYLSLYEEVGGAEV